MAQTMCRLSHRKNISPLAPIPCNRSRTIPYLLPSPQKRSPKPKPEAKREAQFPLLALPLELRQIIYNYALTIPNEYNINRPLIVVNDRGTNAFTARGRYRALSMCPSWVGEDGQVRNLLSVNRQIHDEVEDLLYSQHTLFFLNSFNLDRMGAFLDTLSDTARRRIRSVGFEVCFFVHAQTGVPKRRLRDYDRAARMLAEKLPRWSSVLLYLEPRSYFPSAAVGGRDLSARGVLYLARLFAALRKDLQVCALPAVHKHVMDDVQMGWSLL